MEGNKVITKDMFDKAYVGKNVWVRCETEQKARELLHLAHGFGYKWNSGDSYLSDICGVWQRGENTVYNIYRGKFSSVCYEVMANKNIVIDYVSLVKRHPQEKDIIIKHEYF